MIKLALLARLEAKPGKEEAVADLLANALALARQERGTVTWYALRMSPTTFGVFDTFNDESGRNAHLNGPIAAALAAKAGELLQMAPVIEPVEVLAAK
jgi:quinol monooxygenase YgiN